MERILHIGFSDNPGGVENVVMNYYREIVSKGIEFDFVDLYGNNVAFAEEIASLGGIIYSTPNYKRHPIKAYYHLCSIIRKNGYKVIHIHMQSTANLLPIIAGLRTGCTVIAHSHSSSTPKGLLRKALHLINVPIIRHLPIEKYACGIKAGEWMWGSHFDHTHIIPNATDLSRFAFDEKSRTSIRRQIGFENCLVLGFIGRFGDEKNTFFLIDVLESLLKIESSARLLTVGGNGLYDEFYAELNRRELTDYYYSAGIQSDTSTWYQAMDAFLMPSFFEGFPMVAVEAQASGLPCFLSDRISNEIDLSNKVHFLPIDSSECSCIWANAVFNNISSNRTDLSETLLGYETSNAVDQLFEIYKSLNT